MTTKRQYVKPAFEVVVLRNQSRILAGSNFPKSAGLNVVYEQEDI